MPESIASRIVAFNQGRDPTLLAQKYQKMAESALLFFRGSCHLFYEDWHQSPADVQQAPITWVCGDLHLDNFGSYRGGNGLTYFDINDFDESALAPCAVDLVRLMTSLYLLGWEPNAPITTTQAEVLGGELIHAYCRTLQSGKAQWVERDTATGLVHDLLRQQRKQKRKAFLKARTYKSEQSGGDRQLTLRPGKTRPIDAEMYTAIAKQFTQFAQHHINPEDLGDWQITDPAQFFRVLDIVERIAGTGSLGLSRYMLLIYGGGKHQHYLLDLKIQRPSCVASYLSIPQPSWTGDADRIVTAQTYLQAIAPACLYALPLGSQAYVLREYQPTEAKLNLMSSDQRPEWSALMRTLGSVVASAHLRSSGRRGAAIAEELIEFALNSNVWQVAVLSYARHYSQTVLQNWQDFKGSLDESSNNPKNTSD